MTTTTTRQLPHDSGSESVVLAAILNRGVSVMDELEGLEPSHFFLRHNRLIFGACVALREAGAVVEVESVISKLKDLGQLEEVGGTHRVWEVASSFITSENAAFYASRLADKAALRRAIDLGTKATQMAFECQDDAEGVIASIEQEALRLRESSTRIDANELAAGCDEVLANIKLREDGKHGKIAMATGVSAWDDAFYGVMKNRQYLVAARPGVGKTALVETIAVNVAESGNHVLVISLEMARDRLLERMAARVAHVDYGKYLRGFPTREESERLAATIERFRGLPIHLWAPASATAQQVRGIVRRAARRGVKLFILDYFSRLNIAGSGEKRNESFALAASTITAAIRESGMPGIVVCQLTRESEKERLRLGHLGETSQLEKDADAVLLLDCEDMKAEPREVLFAVEKNRDGALGVTKMLFDGPTMTFRDNDRRQKVL